MPIGRLKLRIIRVKIYTIQNIKQLLNEVE